MFKIIIPIIILLLMSTTTAAQKKRPRELGIEIGILQTGPKNAVTDVPGVKVGHVTVIEGDHVRTGVTAIIPHNNNIFQNKLPAAIYIGNGYGKLAGYSQVKELGTLETPIILTNTLSVAQGIEGLISYTLEQIGNEDVRSVNAVVGETNDGYLNDIRGRHINQDHILQAIEFANTDQTNEGNIGAGTGTVCFGWKGGIGTSSRKLPESLGGYTLGVLVQTNFGGVLQVNGVPVGQDLDQYYLRDQLNNSGDGSCMMVVMTDAPLDARNLERIAKRAMLGLAKTGGIASNGSGDYVIAVSTSKSVRIPNNEQRTMEVQLLKNSAMSPLFMATIEATEEAIINSLFAAETMTGRDGNTIEALPVNRVLEIMKKYGKL